MAPLPSFMDDPPSGPRIPNSTVLLGITFAALLLYFVLPESFTLFFLFFVGVGAFVVITIQLLQNNRGFTPMDLAGVEPLKRIHRPGHEEPPQVAPLPDTIHEQLAKVSEEIQKGALTLAGRELATIVTSHGEHPDVLKAQLELLVQEGRWETVQAAAEQLIDKRPNEVYAWIVCSDAMNTMGFSRKAFDQLLRVRRTFPEDPKIPYHLAQYSCCMGRLEDAHRWLLKAFDLGGRFLVREAALKDPLLKPLVVWLNQKVLVEKILSGGLPGAEQAGLDFALAHGISRGGWCRNPETSDEQYRAKVYGLVPLKETSIHEQFECNIRYSDATVVFSISERMAGLPSRAPEVGHRFKKPVLHIYRENFHSPPGETLLNFLRRHTVKSLNITGPKSSVEPELAEFVLQTLENAHSLSLSSLLD